jgi:16S rRNA (guanine527-N7)-methyltransferase
MNKHANRSATPVPLSITDAQIESALSPFGVRLSADQVGKVREYVQLLLKWNRSTNLTSIVDPMEILARHFGESTFVCSLMPVENCRLADVGSGAGFPGLALKIARPSLHVTLIESNKKKCAFLSEVVRVLELRNVEILPARFDEIRVASDFAEIITARALGGFTDLLRWSSAALMRRGHVILWLGGEDTTIVSGTPGWLWRAAIRIPESQRRFIMIGRPKVGKDLPPLGR